MKENKNKNHKMKKKIIKKMGNCITQRKHTPTE